MAGEKGGKGKAAMAAAESDKKPKAAVLLAAEKKKAVAAESVEKIKAAIDSDGDDDNHGGTEFVHAGEDVYGDTKDCYDDYDYDDEAEEDDDYDDEAEEDDDDDDEAEEEDDDEELRTVDTLGQVKALVKYLKSDPAITAGIIVDVLVTGVPSARQAKAMLEAIDEIPVGHRRYNVDRLAKVKDVHDSLCCAINTHIPRLRKQPGSPKAKSHLRREAERLLGGARMVGGEFRERSKKLHAEMVAYADRVGEPKNSPELRKLRTSVNRFLNAVVVFP